MEPAVKLHISDASDTAEEKQIAAALQKLVDNSQDAAQVAKEIDATIMTENANADEPDAAGWMKYLWDCLGKAAMEVPATHPAQDRMVALLQQLQQLPKHNARQFAEGSVAHLELWNLTAANKYEGFEQWLWTLNEGNFTGHQQVEKSESAATAYINFSAFLARLLAAGQVEATRLSALIRPSPFATRRPSDDAAAADDVYASAAAQWIIYAGEVLFEMCEKDALIEIGKQKWTRALWNGWSAKFVAVASSGKASARTRDLAMRASRRIQDIEAKGVTTNVVAQLGFYTTEEDSDGD